MSTKMTIMTMPIERLENPHPHPTFAKVCAALDALHIDLGDQCRVVDRLRALVERGPRKHILVIEGPAGVGKTRSIEVANGTIQSMEVAALPVNICRVRCTGTTNASVLGELICLDLRVPPSGLGNPARLASYIQIQMPKKGRQLLIVDNSHFLDQEGRSGEGVLRILGSVIASGAASVALVGREKTSAIGKRLKEVVAQTMEVVPVEPLKYENGQDLDAIKAFLGLLADGLKPALAGSGVELKLHTDDMAKRFWAGAWGVEGLMITLVLETLRTVLEGPALQTSSYLIGKDDFAEAWRVFAASETPLTFNPFSRHDAPTLGEIEQARARVKQKAEEQNSVVLPKAPRGPGARIWS
ncbi:hypothetical protein ACM41_06335 [Bradyrhizobium sp. CCBAU 21362]|nr:hypothetical protein [Bradyrhizobium sp. CCBAU 21362]